MVKFGCKPTFHTLATCLIKAGEIPSGFGKLYIKKHSVLDEIVNESQSKL